jgi:hypothetical protein
MQLIAVSQFYQIRRSVNVFIVLVRTGTFIFALLNSVDYVCSEFLNSHSCFLFHPSYC